MNVPRQVVRKEPGAYSFTRTCLLSSSSGSAAMAAAMLPTEKLKPVPSNPAGLDLRKAANIQIVQASLRASRNQGRSPQWR